MSFELTWEKISSVPGSHKIDLSSFGINSLQDISDLGDMVVPFGITLEILKGWTRPSVTQAHMRNFAEIAARATAGFRKRRHFWHIPAIFIAAAQVVMFAFAIGPLFSQQGIPKFLLSCQLNG
jgi:hypothetical protein